MKIGVVAIQGDYEKHQKVLNKLNIDSVFVRNPEQLKQCDALIIPGGESTTLMKLFNAANLTKAIKKFARKKSVMGTCAGLIVLANQVRNPSQESLKLIDLEVDRNAYGRQIDSFIEDVVLNLGDGESEAFEGIFIRAPRISKKGEGIRTLGFLGDEVVLAENHLVLVATFHPELTEDTRIHEYFIKKVSKNK